MRQGGGSCAGDLHPDSAYWHRKTLALLHFALRQCRKNGQQRIIIVLPFITLTEQNAIEYRKILGDDVLLEDHSQRQLTEEQRKFAQRWDMPVIVTTSVRFSRGCLRQKPESSETASVGEFCNHFR